MTDPPTASAWRLVSDPSAPLAPTSLSGTQVPSSDWQGLTRRHFFGRTATGIGVAALGSLLGSESWAETTAGSGSSGVLPEIVPGEPGVIRSLHHAPKAKRVIYLVMNGGPSQMDLFDPKPAMRDRFDEDLPESIINGQRFTTMTSGQKRFPIAPSKFAFAQHGQSGAWVSELLPHTAGVVDDLCFIKSVHTEAINHDPAITYLTTGSQIPGRPSLGAWLSYGLGSGNRDLPSFVVMTASWSGRKAAQALYERLWGAGFLPTRHSGVRLRSDGDPVLYLQDPPGVARTTRRTMLDTLQAMNEQAYQASLDPEIVDRIAQYEMAYRMQTSVPELTDFSGETKETLDLYGPDVQKPGTFASSCLLARRLTERGVNFVQIFHRGWDQHGSLPRDLTNQCRDVDQASAALVTDLKRRGLLEDTLVVWGGEFGRTIYCQGKLTKDDYGRDHHPRCFTVWMAGGGIKPGLSYGQTDEFGYNVTENPVHIHDLNATILHLLGINHKRLTFQHQGRDFRLTDVHGQLVKPILS